MSRRVLFALAAVVVSAILTLIGTFSGPDDDAFWTWLVVLGIILVGTAIVFWLIVPRIGNVGRGALVLAVVGALTILVFWTGLPAIFAPAAALLALTARERGPAPGAATAALAIAALTVATATVVAFIG